MRQTPLLQAVTALLKSENRPVSVPEIQTLLSDQGVTPNKTSLYRLLEKLTAEGQVQNVLLDHKTAYYEWQRHHHHHFTCNTCETVKCLEDPELEEKINALEGALQSKGLKIQAHHFSLTGQCAQCT